MLNQQQELDQNTLFEVLETAVEDFVIYQKPISISYKSRAQKNKEKIEKIKSYTKDPLLKKQRKRGEKAKLHQIIDNMSKEQARIYLDQKKQKKKEEKLKVRASMATGQIMMLDLVYEDKMNEKQNKSLTKQIQLIMKVIKQFQQPPSIHLCNFKGKIKQIMEKMKYEYWAITTHEEDIFTIGKQLNKQLIYLSPDAELTLDVIEPGQAFILGGLIDRTILKNASLTRAKQLGIQARKLPIREYMSGRTCLNLDHVVNMICKFKQTNSWKEAFDFAAPKRWKKEELAGNANQDQQTSNLLQESIQQDVISGKEIQKQSAQEQ